MKNAYSNNQQMLDNYEIEPTTNSKKIEHHSLSREKARTFTLNLLKQYSQEQEECVNQQEWFKKLLKPTGQSPITVMNSRALTQEQTEKNKMEEQEKEVLVNWNDVNKESNDSLYVNTEEFRERVTIVMTNVRVVKDVEKKKFKSEELELKDELRADVLTINDEKEVRRLWNTSKRLQQAIGKYTEPLGTPEEVMKLTISFRIKKVGKETSVNYDVEDFAVLDAIIDE